ncbi:MAG: GTPase Era [Bacteroides sp.]|nr:MAG: GTPase Era [Bacteroides sp.]
MNQYKSGFVSIIGPSNSGKSTLMNAILNFQLSPVTSKIQTTKERISGIYNNDKIQFILYDNPGFINKSYNKLLYKYMERASISSIYNSDIILLVIDINNSIECNIKIIQSIINKVRNPLKILLNKCDLVSQDICDIYKKINKDIIFISSKKKTNIPDLIQNIINILPFHKPYFNLKNNISDKNNRFFIPKIIEKYILKSYYYEIPYSTYVLLKEFKEKEDISIISCEIIVEKKSQVSIILGNKGLMLKKIAIQSRKEIEIFIGQKVYLDLFVRVICNWRDNDNFLKTFVYNK